MGQVKQTMPLVWEASWRVNRNTRQKKRPANACVVNARNGKAWLVLNELKAVCRL
jgi:hypothetical protein